MHELMRTPLGAEVRIEACLHLLQGKIDVLLGREDAVGPGTEVPALLQPGPARVVRRVPPVQAATAQLVVIPAARC